MSSGLDQYLDVIKSNGEATATIPAGSAVIQGDNPHEVLMPSVYNDGSIVGVSLFTQDTADGPVVLRRHGLVLMKASGAIVAGARVNINGTGGEAKTVNESAGTIVHCVGFAHTAAASNNVIINVMIHEHVV